MKTLKGVFLDIQYKIDANLLLYVF